MNQKIDTLRLSIPTAKARTAAFGKLSILVTGLAAIVLVALALYSAVAPPTATNPALAGAGRHATSTANAMEATLLVANPELRLFQRHAAELSARAAAEFFARNPEVRVLQRSRASAKHRF